MSARLSAGILGVLILGIAGCGIQVVTGSPPRTAPTSSSPGTGDAPRATGSVPQNADVIGLRAAGREHLQAGRWDAAIQSLESAYRADSHDGETKRLLCDAFNQRAVARYSADQLPGAISDLRRSLELDPDQSDIRTQLTRAETRLQRLNAIGKEGSGTPGP